MKLIFCLSLTMLASGVQAREVSVSVFPREQASGFRLLVPGRMSEAELDIEPERPQLQTEFAEPAPSSAGSEQPEPPLAGVSFAATLHIPDWMRGRRSVFERYSGPTVSAFMSPECRNPVYHPYPGLASSAEARRRRYFHDMVTAACESGIPVSLFDSLIVQESRYSPTARSRVGAMGLAQLMPGTARDLGVFNVWDVRQNLRGGARYLKAQLDEFGEWHLALSAYNAGPGAVRRHGGIPPYRETMNYVRTILSAVRTNLAASAVEPRKPPIRRVALASYRGS